MSESRWHRRIITCYDPKPGPLQVFNWEAVDDDIEDLTGYGATERAAIDQLLDMLETRMEAAEAKRRAKGGL